MDADRMTGEAKKVGGKIEGAVGDLTGDRRTQAEGKATEAKGTVENLLGQAKDAVRDAADEGTKLADAAAQRIGQSVPQAERAYRQGSEAVTQYAKGAPFITLLLAAVGGYILSTLLHRRS